MAEESPSPYDFKTLLHNHIDAHPIDSIFVCFLCSFESTDPIQLLEHLRTFHRFVFTDLLHIPLLPRYLEYWRLHPPPISEYSTGQSTIDINSQEDIEIRNSLHKIRLDQIMTEHESERTEVNHIQCIFCLEEFDGTWHEYLQWLFEKHQFNPGRPSNLIYIPQMINLLRTELESNVCIFCSSTFPNQRTLRSHMRKKKHMRIPNDPYFDRFYMVNYLELNGDWTSEDDDADFFNEPMEPLEQAAAADSEREINETFCLICDNAYPSPEEAIWHMRQVHHFDISEVRRKANNDFYNCVRFCNFARFMKKRNMCFICRESVDAENYVEHFDSHEEKFPKDTNGIFGEDQLLIPIIDGDPLLTELEDEI